MTLHAINIMMEAASEPWPGLVAVGLVVRHRAEDDKKRWPRTLRDVILQQKQFSWTLSEDLREKCLDPIKFRGKDVWRFCCSAAILTASDLYPDIVNGANHYFATKGPNAIPAPNWAHGMKEIGSIGNHTFYRG